MPDSASAPHTSDLQSRLYADHAATSFPKAPGVIEAMTDYLARVGASPGRGSYRESLEGGELLARCRRILAQLIRAEAPEQIVFGLNCSDVLNLAIKGAVRPGDHVVTSRMEHNSILRPLHALSLEGIAVTHVEADPRTGLFTAADVIAAIRPETKLIALQHASNVTGAIQPIAEIGRAARERDILFLVDAAQSLGHLPIDATALKIDLLAFPGHKGLLGPLGTAGLYVRRGIEPRLRPLKEGGTGSASEEVAHPTFMPDRYECGSQNAVGIAGLAAAGEWVLKHGVDALWKHDQALSAAFLDGLRKRFGVREPGRPAGGVTLYGPVDPAQRIAVFALRIDGYEPAELSALLESEFSILTRSGITCAPMAHATLGTLATGGCLRISFGPFAAPADVERCVDALAELSAVQGARSAVS